MGQTVQIGELADAVTSAARLQKRTVKAMSDSATVNPAAAFSCPPSPLTVAWQV